MGEYREIRFERDGKVARIRLNRPDKLNAFTLTMVDELHAALGEAEADESLRAVLLTGEGRAFGAGFDLSVMQAMDLPELGPVLGDRFNPLVRAMRRSRLPIVASVQGACAGGSVGLALACDLVVAGRSAFFYEPFVGIGLVPDVGNTLFLPRLVGRMRAAGMAFLGERIGAEQAEAWGLIWRVFDDAELAEQSKAIADRLAAQPAWALAQTKRLLSAAAEAGLDGQLDLERDLQDQAGRSDDCAAALEAFLGRRRQV